MKPHHIQPVDTDPKFIEAEEHLLKYWYESGIVDKYLHKNDASAKSFSFFDGPITANNPMGVHHGWGRTYKDLWQRYHNLKGYRQRFQNGFDCQGLWVEVEVEKELGFKTKKDIETYGVAEFVAKCKDRVNKYAAIQTKQSQRLGYFMDWDHSYFTMSDANNYMIWHFLKVCHQAGWLYKGNDSVPWCPRCETAISQHEMLTEDYKEITHQSIYLSLPLQGKKHESLLIWTTTPWTIPANIAVAVDKNLTYALVEINDHRYWVAKDAIPRIFGHQPHKIITNVKGQKLVGLKYLAPFDDLDAVKAAAKSSDKFHLVVPSDTTILPITTDEGTGLVHTAVSAGTEDFRLGQKLGLPMIPVIADNADYLDSLGWLAGKNAKKHPEVILDFLRDKHWAFRIEPITHRYPACWRCKTELVWKVTDEWYIAMDRPSTEKQQATSNKKQTNLTLRQRMIEVAKKIHWLPEFGLDRELDWLNNMHDWLISKKNRYWGLCLPIWECPECGTFEVIGSKEELKRKAATGWDKFEGKTPHKPQIDQVKIRCPKCQTLISRIEPVGNPWLDAGIIPFSTLIDPKTKKLSYTSDKKYWRQWFPANFITESFPGQFKNWFYSLIAMSTVLEDSQPFETVLGYGSLLAEDGRPMHKSWGNAIEFNEAASQIGVDIMRWLYVRQNPVNNLLFGVKSAAEIKRQFHLLLWNSYRFFVNNAHADHWQPKNENLPELTHVLDKWIISRLASTQTLVETSLNNFDAFHAALAIEGFVSDLSTWYIRRSRDRVGPATTDQKDKNCAYQTMYFLFVNLSRMLAPFMPFLSDRLYTNLTSQESVHLSDWPTIDKSLIHPELEQHMDRARSIVEKIHAQRKLASLKLRQPLNEVTVSGPTFGKPNLQAIILEETNIKKLKFGPSNKDIVVKLDTKITPELKAEGEVRDLIRLIQQARKDAGTTINQWVSLELPAWPNAFTSEIKQKTLVRELIVGPELKIIKK